MKPHRQFSIPILATLLLPLLLLTACNQLNEGLGVGREVYPPAVIPADRLFDPTEVALDLPVIAPVPPPSVTGVLRENWQDTVVLMPASTVEHRAHHAVHPLFVHNGSRLPDEYPTIETVITEPSLRRNLAQAHEAVWAPVYAALDLVLAIPRAVIAHPWVVQTSPRDAYERMPRVLPRTVPPQLDEDFEDEPPPIQVPPPPAVPPPPPDLAPPPAQPVGGGGGGAMGG